MKSLINSCAVSAVQHDKELREYYLRRISEGKPKMLVLNIIRNKIIARAFATVKRGTPFVELNQLCSIKKGRNYLDLVLECK